MDETSRISKIRHLNDRCRMGDDYTARTVFTDFCLSHFGGNDPIKRLLAQQKLLNAVRCHVFTEECEHDFGKVTVGDDVIFFKIDYYDLEYLFHSDDAADPDKTRRVMTIMLASDY